MSIRTHYVVWRYQLPITGEPCELTLPGGAIVVHTAVKRGDPRTVHLWFEIGLDIQGKPTNSEQRRAFLIVGTGTPWPWDSRSGWFRVGTCLDPDRDLVWHVLEGHNVQNGQP